MTVLSEYDVNLDLTLKIKKAQMETLQELSKGNLDMDAKFVNLNQTDVKSSRSEYIGPILSNRKINKFNENKYFRTFALAFEDDKVTG